MEGRNFVKHLPIFGHVAIGGMPLGRTFEGKVTRIVVLKERKTKKALQNYPT